MKCSEFHDLAAGYALEALSEEERTLCIEHLEHEGPHEGCEALLARFQRAVAQLGQAVEPLPVPPNLWRAIELRLNLAATPRSPARFREALAWMAAAAALLFALSLRNDEQRLASQRNRLEDALTNVGEQLATARSERAACSAALAELSRERALGRAAVSLLEHPATKIAPMAPAANQPYRATALFNPDTKRAVVLSTTVTEVPDKDYELWVIAAGEAPRPAGFLRFDPSGVALGEFDEALLRAATPAALAVSLEPKGGRPTPTEVVLIAKLQG